MSNSDIDSILKTYDEDPNNPEYNEELMRYYVEHGMNIPAKEIADKFPEYAPIQLLLMEIYQGDRNKEGMAQIAERFPNDIKIQSIAIGMYINDKNIEKVNEILGRFPTYDRDLHYKTCTKLKDKGNYSAVKRIGKMFPDVSEIQGQVMSVYIRELKYLEAEEIGKREIFADESNVQSKMMRIYRIKENYQEADDLAERFLDSPEVQYEYMKILQARKQFVKIGEIAKRFPKNDKITKLRNQIRNRYKAKRRAKEGNGGEEKETQLTEEEMILREIYNNNIDANLLGRINNIDNPVIRYVLTTARYDRTQAKTDLRKQHIRTMKQSPEYSDYEKIFNKLITKLNGNPKIFDYEFYHEQLIQVRNREDEILNHIEEVPNKENESTVVDPEIKKTAEGVNNGTVVEPRLTSETEAAEETQPEISAKDMLQRIIQGKISEGEARQLANKYPGLSGTVLLAAYFKKRGSDKEISRAVEIMNKCSKEDPDQSSQSVYEGVIEALESPEFSTDSFKNILKKAIELDGTDRDTESPEKEKDITPEQHKEKTPRDILNEITAGTITAKEVADLEGKYSYPVYAILVAAMLKKSGNEEKIQEISKIFEKGIEEDQDPERVIIYKRVCGALRTEKYPSNAFSSILEDTIKLEEEHPEHQGEEEIK